MACGRPGPSRAAGDTPQARRRPPSHCCWTPGPRSGWRCGRWPRPRWSRPPWSGEQGLGGGLATLPSGHQQGHQEGHGVESGLGAGPAGGRPRQGGPPPETLPPLWGQKGVSEGPLGGRLPPKPQHLVTGPSLGLRSLHLGVACFQPQEGRSAGSKWGAGTVPWGQSGACPAPLPGR